MLTLYRPSSIDRTLTNSRILCQCTPKLQNTWFLLIHTIYIYACLHTIYIYIYTHTVYVCIQHFYVYIYYTLYIYIHYIYIHIHGIYIHCINIYIHYICVCMPKVLLLRAINQLGYLGGHQVPHYFRYGGLCDLSHPEEHGRLDQHDSAESDYMGDLMISRSICHNVDIYETQLESHGLK